MKSKGLHPNDRPRKCMDVKGTTSLAGNFIYYLVDYFLHDIANSLQFEKPARGNDVYMLPLISCVLVAAELEALRNHLYFAKKLARNKKGGIGRDISVLFSDIPEFPTQKLSQAINEIFILRDSIMHGHMYEVSATYWHGTWEDPFTMDTKNYRLKKISPKLVKQGDEKFRKFVDFRHRKTEYLKLNVIPLNVCFTDLFKLLMLFDVLDCIYLRKTDKRFFHLPLAVHGMIRGGPRERPESTDDVPGNLGQILGYYYSEKVEIIKDNNSKVLRPLSRDKRRFKKEIDEVFKKLRNDFHEFVGELDTNGDGGIASKVETCVIKNVCPKCGVFGFQTPFHRYGKCRKCSFEDSREKRYDNPYFSL